MTKSGSEILFDAIKKGRAGENKGVPIFPRLDNYINGLGYGKQYLIGAPSGMEIKSGIYKLIIENKIYIGSSVNLEQRLKTHKRQLLSGTHGNNKLQNAYNKYKNFDFELVEFVERDKLQQREQYWIDLLNPYYNLDFNVDRSVRTYETKQKISAALKGNSNAGKRTSVMKDGVIIEFNSIKQCCVELNITKSQLSLLVV